MHNNAPNGNQSAPLPMGYILKERYEIQEEVGRGSMSVVYRAHMLPEKKVVAVKVLGFEFCEDIEVKARFYREAQIGNRVRHPNIVEVFDHDLTPWGSPFLVEEFLEGRDLQSRLEDGDTLSLREILFLLIELCSALEIVHKLGVVHRDIKPGNVILGPGPNGKLQVKLIDFGLAKLLNNSNGAALTAHLGAIGTLAYMPPEQIQGKPLDPRADIYALGVILYQLLSGSLPLWSESPNELTELVLEQKAVDIRRRAHGRVLPIPLAKITMQALAKNREKRPKNVEIFREKLQQIRQELAHGVVQQSFLKRFFFRYLWGGY